MSLRGMTVFRGLVTFLLSFLSGVFFVGALFFTTASFTTGNFTLLYVALACIVLSIGTYAKSDDFFPKL